MEVVASCEEGKLLVDREGEAGGGGDRGVHRVCGLEGDGVDLRLGVRAAPASAAAGIGPSSAAGERGGDDREHGGAEDWEESAAA
jgi:hypothetical protein